jgi:hypothetical protein
MMTHHEYAISYLKALERRYTKYFASANRSIMDYVKIQGFNNVTIQLTGEALPKEVKHDIEMMFWID